MLDFIRWAVGFLVTFSILFGGHGLAQADIKTSNYDDDIFGCKTTETPFNDTHYATLYYPICEDQNKPTEMLISYTESSK